MARPNATARDMGLLLGLEVVSGFDLIRTWNLPHVGVTLDVGHMYAEAEPQPQPLEPFGSIGTVVHHVADILVHLHVHDVAERDHSEIGTGRVDFADLLTALREVGYTRGMCLEMNPDRVSPDGIRRSLARLRRGGVP